MDHGPSVEHDKAADVLYNANIDRAKGTHIQAKPGDTIIKGLDVTVLSADGDPIGCRSRGPASPMRSAQISSRTMPI